MKIGEKLKSLVLFALMGAFDFVAYFLMMFAAAGYLNNQPAMPEGKHHPLLYVLFAVCAVLYILPLYILLFANNVSLKTALLHLTSAEMGGFSSKKVFQYVAKEQGISDLAVYAVYSMLMLLPFPGADRNPFVYILMQETFFHELPIPSVVSWILAVAFFALQYALCVYIAANKWNRERIRP